MLQSPDTRTIFVGEIRGEIAGMCSAQLMVSTAMGTPAKLFSSTCIGTGRPPAPVGAEAFSVRLCASFLEVSACGKRLDSPGVVHDISLSVVFKVDPDPASLLLAKTICPPVEVILEIEVAVEKVTVGFVESHVNKACRRARLGTSDDTVGSDQNL